MSNLLRPHESQHARPPCPSPTPGAHSNSCTRVHQVSDAIQPSHPLSSPSPPVPNPSQHQGLFQWVNSLHEVAKVLEFQLQYQSFQWTPRTGLLQNGLVESPSGWGLDTDYCDIESFALETNRDHSVIFEIASKYCILDSFVEYEGYSISSKRILAHSSRHWNSPIPVQFNWMIPKMSKFTLVISCLTTSSLAWFMDLTFQVPMQYCSL